MAFGGRGMKSLALIAWIGLAGLASFALFNITFKVEKLQDELSTLNRQLLKEQKAVHVLRAEWAYLSRPERIEALSQRLLPHLQPPTALQVGDIESLSAQAAALREPGANDAQGIRPAMVRGTQ
jgi:hypothetical protein